MKIKNPNIQELNSSEIVEINGGGWGGVAGLYAAVLACAYYVGYYNGKEDCPPKPCE